MNHKKKGCDAERELVKAFWENGWACVRSAGSGSMQYPSPDIIASNSIRKIAIESKSTKGTSKYFDKNEIKQLKNFCEYFGAESWIAVKFQKNWFLVTLEELKETPKGYSINIKSCELKGISLQDFFTY